MKKINFLIGSISVITVLNLCNLLDLSGQNLSINTDGTPGETGVMLDIKEPTAKATTAAVQTFFQIKSFDANTDALKLRFGFKTDVTQANRYGFIDFPDFTASVPTYLPLCLQPSGGNVGIGTTSPVLKLHVSNTAPTGILIDRFSGNEWSNEFKTRKSRGTESAPTAVALNDELGGLELWGYDGSATRMGAMVRAYVDGTPIAGSSLPGRLSFFVNPGGATATMTSGFDYGTEAMTIKSSGNVGIGTGIPTSKLQVVGLPVYANNAAAIAGGLTAGAFYRTGGDPSLVSVVF